MFIFKTIRLHEPRAGHWCAGYRLDGAMSPVSFDPPEGEANDDDDGRWRG
ncbi:hypothetical protein ZHAS_00004371 [Anopheles sinensis]|uniref:Uncharacterized protein n=1 Tax=Anopheles sinensis TaxID=74873 RepID=A0A084VGS0_ANOSI|nr:hypothetical protein ZHAS_00004371 [Anopheles sinensis]